MYLGRIVEMGLAREHRASTAPIPTLRILWSSLADKRSTEVREPRAWGVFDFEQPVSGCRFAPPLPALPGSRAAPPSAPTPRPSRRCGTQGKGT